MPPLSDSSYKFLCFFFTIIFYYFFFYFGEISTAFWGHSLFFVFIVDYVKFL